MDMPVPDKGWGAPHIAYHSARFVGNPTEFDVEGDFCMVPVTGELAPCGPHRILCRAQEGHPDFRRVSDFAPVADEKEGAFAFCTAGRRLQGRIFLVPVTGLGRRG